MSQKEAREREEAEGRERLARQRRKIVMNTVSWVLPAIAVMSLAANGLQLLQVRNDSGAQLVAAKVAAKQAEAQEAQEVLYGRWTDLVKISSGVDVARLVSDAEAGEKMQQQVISAPQDASELLYEHGIDSSTQYASQFLPQADEELRGFEQPTVLEHTMVLDALGPEGGTHHYVVTMVVGEKGSDPAKVSGDALRHAVVVYSTQGDKIVKDAHGYWVSSVQRS